MKAVLFDMDGVLVDVSKSYRLTINPCHFKRSRDSKTGVN